MKLSKVQHLVLAQRMNLLAPLAGCARRLCGRMILGVPPSRGWVGPFDGGLWMGLDRQAPGAAVLRLVPGVTLLRADKQVFGAMLDGWADQKLARNLAPATITGRAAAVNAFAAHVNAEPWEWSAQMLDEWLGELRGPARSMVRGYARSQRRRSAST